MCVCLQNTQRHLKTKLRETDDGTGMIIGGFLVEVFFFEEREKDSLSPPRPPTHNARALPQNRTKPLIFKRKRERERRSFLLPVLLLFFPRVLSLSPSISCRFVAARW